jgi:hypothetical protein
MSTVEVDVQVSDDEVVANAVAAGVPWEGMLPTVETGDAASLTAAAARGQRSLLLRESSTEDFPLVLAAASGSVRLVAYFRDPNGEAAPGSVLYYAFQDSQGRWIQDVVAPLGVHYFGERNLEQVVDAVSGLIDEARTNAIPEHPDVALSVALPQQDTILTLTISALGNRSSAIDPTDLSEVDHGALDDTSLVDRLRAAMRDAR